MSDVEVLEITGSDSVVIDVTEVDDLVTIEVSEAGDTAVLEVLGDSVEVIEIEADDQNISLEIQDGSTPIEILEVGPLDGADGRTLLHGHGPPSDLLDGVDEDFYIDEDAWDIYGPKTLGAWGLPTSLIGPGGSGTNEWVSEVPAGDVDGVNALFETSFDFQPDSTRVFLNGLRQFIAVNYAEVPPNQVDLSFIPLPGDALVVDYIKA